MTNSEIGPFKKTFLLFAAWCFDFCLVVVMCLVVFTFVPRIVGPLCPYLLHTYATNGLIFGYLPAAISLWAATLLSVIATASPGRYLADLSAESANPTSTLKRVPLIIALPLLLIYSSGIAFFTSDEIRQHQDPNRQSISPEVAAIFAALDDVDDLDKFFHITWQDLTNPSNSAAKAHDYQVTTDLSKEHTLSNDDLSDAGETHWHGFHTAKALTGRVLARDLKRHDFLDICDILITGLEYKQRQQNFLATANKIFQRNLMELKKEPISPENLRKRSELLGKMGQTPAALTLLSANLPIVEKDFDLSKELFYKQKNMGHYKEALATCNKLIAQTPWLADWYVTAATVSYSLGNYKESLTYLEKAEKTLPFTLGEALGTTAAFHKFKAQCLKHTGNQQASAKEMKLSQNIRKRFMASFSDTMPEIPAGKNEIRKLEIILAHYNPAQLKGQVIEPHVYTPEAKALVERFKNKKPSAKEIQEVLGRSLNQQLDQLYQIELMYEFSAAVAVKPLPPKERELSKLAAELAKAW